MPSVLIVDDLLSIHEMLDAVIQPTGYTTAFATDGEKALTRYKQDKFDLVLADIDMKPMDGITLLRKLKDYDPNCVVLIMTAYASTESAVQALKYGAFDYLQKPFRVDELISTLKRAMEFRELNESQHAAAAPAVASGAQPLEEIIIGSSAYAKRLVAQVKKLAAGKTPVLLQGELGTGVALVAEAIHSHGATAEGEIVRIDCGLNDAGQLQHGLIGTNGEGGQWVKDARGGTLFLQNIEKLPREIQAALIGVLRNHGNDFRLICSTSVDLEKLTDTGHFNDELFYRVASLPVHLEPLRERIEDLPLLVRHYVKQASNPHFDANLVEFTPDALAAMSSYSWPGNLTELSQLVIKIASTTETRLVTVKQLPLRIKDLESWPTLEEHLEQERRSYIERVLHACHGDSTRAARILGVSESSLG